MIRLNNNQLTVKINKLGAEIKSIYTNNREYIWEGREDIWSDSSPLLFPVCGSLKDDKYVFEGTEYSLPKHGYAKNTLFEVEALSDTRVVFLHKSTEETRKVYPFDYELRVIYTIENASLKVEYKIDNKSDKAMFFSIGSHEGYSTPEGIENYDVIFPQKETLDTTLLCGSILSKDTMPVMKDTNILPLCEKYFDLDSLIFTDIKSHSVILQSRNTKRAIKIDFDFAPNLLIWHKPNSPYICIEPWAGLPDIVDSSYDITKKEGIISLNSGKTYIAEHKITILG